MEDTGSIEALIVFGDGSRETFLENNPRIVADKISGRQVRGARVRLLTARQRTGFGYADTSDQDENEGVFACAHRRAMRNRSERLAPKESRR
jgi:hypothetical protein